jgi:hypothetical protein
VGGTEEEEKDNVEYRETDCGDGKELESCTGRTWVLLPEN